MRSFADRSPDATREPAVRSQPVSPVPDAAARALGVPGSPMSPGIVAHLQAMAGNRATVQALRPGRPVQRVIDAGQAAALAARLNEAMEGWGTDEEAVYGALTSRTPEDLDAIREAYFLNYNKSLLDDINDEFSGDELARVLRLLQGTAGPAATATPAETAVAGASNARAIAEQLRDAMAGWGTEEAQIFNALEGRTPTELNEIARQYATLTGHALEQDLTDEMSGDELQRALDLLGVVRSGVFTNEVEQNMTEGVTTVVQGRFEWSLTRNEVRVEAGVKFVPDAGVSPPYGEWDTQINDTWNQYAVIEPGGRRLPIVLRLRNDAGADREVAVHRNADPANWQDDRADAGNWFVRMKPATAPHEFGHLIGLQDEYQRTHGDMRRITGADPAAGTPNASTKTPAEIAGLLHTALTLADATRRSPEATTVCQSVGLIDANGVPQQGDFAQSVKTAFDAAYQPTLVDTMRDNLPPRQKWTLQTVFSYATRSIMGNPEGISQYGAAPLPHDHAVEARHLAEFARLVKGVWPQFDWTVGPK